MKMYVRYVGTRHACWTIKGGKFYTGSRDELTAEERAVCEQGGGWMPLSLAVAVVAR